MRASWAWCLLCLLTWIVLVQTSEWFLPATLLAYGPRFVLLLPFVALIPLALITSRIALIPLSVALLVVLGPIMGARLAWETILHRQPAASHPDVLRVLTFNTEGGDAIAKQLRELVSRQIPDIIALQECGDVLWDSLQALPRWHSARYAQMCSASRWPIASTDTMPRRGFERISKFGFGGTGGAVRYVFDTPKGPLALVNLHLETARKGLEGLMGKDGFVPDQLRLPEPETAKHSEEMSSRITLNTKIRDLESERASVWSVHFERAIPVLIAGDFNLPVESAIFRKHWGAFTDAFESSGTGFGWTKSEGRLLHIRIDHILGSEMAPRPVGIWLGADLGSDHLPVIADFRWR